MAGANVGSVTRSPETAVLSGQDVTVVDRVRAGMAAVDQATELLDRVVDAMDEAAALRPSLIAGWTRGHVLTHLARNADALVNLLTWARTGVEHPMYASTADREADIREGGTRSLRLLREDLAAACGRFSVAADRMPDNAWRAEVTIWEGVPLRAYEIPWLRLNEVLVHLVDLNRGVEFADLAEEHLVEMLEEAVTRFSLQPEIPAMRLEAVLTDGSRRTWHLHGDQGRSRTVRGPASSMAAWLTGRSDGSELLGEPPRLPAWI